MKNKECPVICQKKKERLLSDISKEFANQLLSYNLTKHRKKNIKLGEKIPTSWLSSPSALNWVTVAEPSTMM